MGFIRAAPTPAPGLQHMLDFVPFQAVRVVLPMWKLSNMHCRKMDSVKLLHLSVKVVVTSKDNLWNWQSHLRFVPNLMDMSHLHDTTVISLLLKMLDLCYKNWRLWESALCVSCHTSIMS